MPKIFIATAVAGIGLAAAVAATDIRPSGKLVELGHSLAAGIILGSAVWPYGLSPVQTDLQSKLLLDSPGCDGDDQCGMYGLASATFVNTGSDTAD